MAELFHYQSSRWLKIAKIHLATIFDGVESFIDAVLRYVTSEENCLLEISERTRTALRKSKLQAEEELERLWNDELQQPITYNHYYTDNVQRSRQDSTRSQIKKAMLDASVEEYNGKLHISNTKVDAEKLLNSLQTRITVNMDDQACSEAISALESYYKVATIKRAG